MLVIKMSASKKLIDTVLRNLGFDALFDFHGKVSTYFLFLKKKMRYCTEQAENLTPLFICLKFQFIPTTTQKNPNSGLDNKGAFVEFLM